MPGEEVAASGSMGAMLPVLGVSAGATVLGSVLNGVADRQAMRAMMGEKQKQLRLWQAKRSLDNQAQADDIQRQLREIGGMRDVSALGDQNANNITSGTEGVMQALQGLQLPGNGQTGQDLTASLLPALLEHAKSQAFQDQGSMEDRNQGGMRLGNKLRDTNFRLQSSLFPGQERRAQMRGSGLRLGAQILGLGGGVGAAVAPFLSGPTKATQPSPAGDFRENPNPGWA